jgi:hypothetical protein
MKFEVPSLGYFVKTIIIALLLAILGFVVYPYLALDNLSMQRVFSYAILTGAVIGSLITAVRIKLSGENRTESIFVGNLAFKMPPNALRELFEQYGQVHAVRLMTDRVTRKPRGFGFVEMNRKQARAAIRALDGTEFFGRQLKVNIANERKSAPENKEA